MDLIHGYNGFQFILGKSSQHKIIRTGDISKLSFPQIWEILDERGFT